MRAANGLTGKGTVLSLGTGVPVPGGTDAGTLIVRPGAGGDGWTTIVASADESNSSTTAASHATLRVPTSIADGTYELQSLIRFQSAATTTGFQPGLVYPAQVTASYRVDVPISATAIVSMHAGASAQYAAGTAVGAVATFYLATIWGVFVKSGTMLTALALSYKSEIASSAVTVKAGSVLRWRKVA